jgi:hypothetical protein
VAKVSISQVKSEWGVSRPTIMKAIKDGKLSGEKDDKGYWAFDPAEVVRWRGEPISAASKEPVEVDSKPDKSQTNPLQAETIDVLKRQVEQLEDQLKTKDDQIGKLQEQNRDQTKLIEHQTEASNRGFFKKLFG